MTVRARYATPAYVCRCGHHHDGHSGPYGEGYCKTDTCPCDGFDPVRFASPNPDATEAEKVRAVVESARRWVKAEDDMLDGVVHAKAWLATALITNLRAAEADLKASIVSLDSPSGEES